ncbi:MAG: hypothetical protein BAA02_04535 [Paenibacillaceae bacterium ZCTH02-B3]|nr:MAG: hypothetical protein BAA02_04535 [Paenibacillaceae bacterium ZCTH02-B3]
MENIGDHEIGRFLAEQGLISEETFLRCMEAAERTGEKLIHILLKEGCVTEKQLLVRRICPECKAEERIPEHVLERTGIRRHPWAPAAFCRGTGCSWCQYTGYKGRIAISEMIFADDEIRELISAQASEPTLKKHLENRGFRTMADDGLRKVAQGITTLEEYLRVIHT